MKCLFCKSINGYDLPIMYALASVRENALGGNVKRAQLGSVSRIDHHSFLQVGSSFYATNTNFVIVSCVFGNRLGVLKAEKGRREKTFLGYIFRWYSLCFFRSDSFFRAQA